MKAPVNAETGHPDVAALTQVCGLAQCELRAAIEADERAKLMPETYNATAHHVAIAKALQVFEYHVEECERERELQHRVTERERSMASRVRAGIR